MSEVTELIRELSDIIKNTREIVKAVNDGRAYLKRNHPDARDDMEKLLGQVEHTVRGLSEVTAVLCAFQFEFTAESRYLQVSEGELARFNEHVIQQNKDIGDLRGRIRELRSDCTSIRKLRDKLASRANSNEWGAMFWLLGGRARKTASDLASKLSDFYADDAIMIGIFERTVEMAEDALIEVSDLLGAPGAAHPFNAPKAASALKGYALLFRQTNRDLARLADRMSDVRSKLKP
ncbi:MAG: hypothetical protein QNJ16_03570 [Rhodobacter sp.]|nr:hypothetical protein [Rhodobacter sp.]